MTAALIITAGRTGSGRTFLPSKEVGTIPAIRRTAQVLQRAGIRRTVVVCGEEQVKKDAGHMGLVFLRGDAQGEMLDNVKIGLSYLQDKCDAALITHVNVPLFSAETVRALAQAQGAVRVPVCRGVPGHPMLLEAEYFPAVLRYTGAGGLAAAVRSLPWRQVEVEDEGVLHNIAGEDNCAQLVASQGLARARFDLRVRLAGERVFYGPGPHQLLELTGESGSLLEACRQMGISYSKGRKIIAAIERQTGHPVITSQQGGPNGGRSVLTAEGRELLERYAAFCEEANARVEELFEKYFPSSEL